MKLLPPFFFALAATAAFAADFAKPETLALGAAAPDFKLPGVDGRDWSLADFKDAKALVVVFNCNHCPTAQAYEERLKKIVADYKPKGVAVVAISPNDPKSVRLDELGYTDLGDTLAEMKIRAKAQAFNFPYLYDGDTEAVSRAYGPVATPHAFVFDGERKLRYVGRIDDSERESLVKTQDLRTALDAVLAGRAPAVAQTKAFGCSIKWAGKLEQVATFMEKLAQEPVSLEPVDVDGLAALRKGEGSKVRLINFWATWCGPCVTEFPDLVEINRMYRRRDFEFVSVSANYPDEKPEALKFLTKQQASNRNLIFGTTDKYKLMEAFDKDWSGALPYTLLLSPAGEVLYKQEGAIEALELKRAIVKALGREKVK
jgi:thiol-disulfide isomerase/thioredoxin